MKCLTPAVNVGVLSATIRHQARRNDEAERLEMEVQPQTRYCSPSCVKHDFISNQEVPNIYFVYRSHQQISFVCAITNGNGAMSLSISLDSDSGDPLLVVGRVPLVGWLYTTLSDTDLK